MALNYQTNARNASCDAIVDLVDVGGGGDVQVATTSFASILATMPLLATAFGAASAGQAALLGTPEDDDAANGGTAAVYRFRDGNGLEVWSGPVALVSGGDIVLSAAARNVGLDAALALINGGDVEFATNDTFSTVLARVNCNTTAFDAASGGSADLDPAGMAVNTLAAGTVTAFRFRTSGGTEVMRGTVGVASGDWPWDNNVVANAQPIVVNGISVSMAATTVASQGALVINNAVIVAGQNVSITSGFYNHPVAA